jgi:hypothetical protein
MPINWGLAQTKKNFTCHQGVMVTKYPFEQQYLFELILKLQSESLKAAGCLWAAYIGDKGQRVPRENLRFLQASVTIQKSPRWQTIATSDSRKQWPKMHRRLTSHDRQRGRWHVVDSTEH